MSVHHAAVCNVSNVNISGSLIKNGTLYMFPWHPWQRHALPFLCIKGGHIPLPLQKENRGLIDLGNTASHAFILTSFHDNKKKKVDTKKKRILEVLLM